MSTGKSGKESNQGKQCTKTLENSKTPCCQARSMELKAGDMDKFRLINILSQAIREICDKDPAEMTDKDGKIKFRHYYRSDKNENILRSMDVTIEL